MKAKTKVSCCVSSAAGLKGFAVLALLVAGHVYAGQGVEKVSKKKGVSEDDISTMIIAKHNGYAITGRDVQAIIATMKPLHKEFIKNNKEKLLEIILNVLVRESMAGEALKLELHKRTITSWELKSARSEVLSAALVENYRKRIQVPGEGLESLAKEWYRSHPEKYMQETKVKISHILLRSVKGTTDQRSEEQQKKAQVILGELNQGLDFAVAAKRYSEDQATASLGGNLGEFEKGRMVPAFDTAAFALKTAGDISGVIKTRYGYHILKLLRRDVPEGVKPYRDVKELILKEVKERHVSREVDKFISSFDINTSSTVFTSVLDAFHEGLKLKEGAK